MKNSVAILLLFLSLVGNDVFATNKIYQRSSNKPLVFTENKGQVKDQSGKVRTDIQYRLNAGKGLNVFIGRGCLHYQFSEKPGRDPDHVVKAKGRKSKKENEFSQYRQSFKMYRLDVRLENASPSASIVCSGRQDFTERYVCGKREIIANSYNRIVYKDIYPNIDWVLYIKDNLLEYDFIVHPGGRVQDIKLNYEGANGINEDNNSVTACTPMGNITEGNLNCYRLEDGRKIASAYEKTGNSISFLAASFKGTLVIDPTLDWSSYFGGSDEHATCLAYGDSGCVYMAGYTTSVSNIATSGAYAATFGGQDDIFLAKTDSTGVLRWATYYGGSGIDEAYGMVYDGSGNIYLSGITTSSSGIATPGTHQAAFGGGVGDAFLARFSSSGSMIWGTYYGGSGSDISTALCKDKQGHIYITGHTYSTDSIATPGAFETSSGDTVNSSGFIAEFNDSGALLYATYYGGDDDVEPLGICSDDSGNVYIAGTTASLTGISTPGAFQMNFQTVADDDGFIARFNSHGMRQWGTYFGAYGSNQLKAIICDGAGNIYLTGGTYCTDSTATSGAYKSTLTGTANAYLTKFNSSGAIVWGTYFGDSSDAGNALAMDGAGNIYITGATLSASGIATPGAWQSALAGEQDAFVAAFSNSGSLEWATYFGGAAYDEAFAAACDDNGYVYIAGITQSTSGLTSPGAFDSVYRATTFGDDVFLARFGPARTIHTAVPEIPVNRPVITIYPDPASDYLHIAISGLPQLPRQVTVYDMSGRQQNSYIYPATADSGAINIAKYPAGSYVIELICGESICRQKFTVTR